MSKAWQAGFWSPEAHGRPKVVVESFDGAVRWVLEKALTDAGYDVASCGGPEANGGPCPLVRDNGCPLIQHADVVVQSLGLSQQDNVDVLRTLRERFPTKPVVVETPRPKAFERAAMLEGCQLVYKPITRAGLIDAVDAALAGSG